MKLPKVAEGWSYLEDQVLSVTPLCTCGEYTESTLQRMREILGEIKEKEDSGYFEITNAYDESLLFICENAGLVHYGISIRCAHITSQGEWWIDAYDRVMANGGFDVHTLPADDEQTIKRRWLIATLDSEFWSELSYELNPDTGLFRLMIDDVYIWPLAKFEVQKFNVTILRSLLHKIIEVYCEGELCAAEAFPDLIAAVINIKPQNLPDA